MKIVLITCYRDPNYVRVTSLRQALEALPDVQVIECKNKNVGLLRYIEVPVKLLWVRITKRPDKYLLTFRGYEILGITNLLTWPKTLIYDEFINPLEWLDENKHKLWARIVPMNILKNFYKLLLKRPAVILADTDSHARYSTKLLGINKPKIVGIPVGTDEELFQTSTKDQKFKEFTVLFYGSMLPLHGLEYAVKAAEELKYEDIKFIFVGGGQKAEAICNKAIEVGAKIEYSSWIEFHKLPDYIRKSHLVLAGPYGDTTQSQYVITTKAYQSLACGTPAIIGHNQESKLFTDKANCLIVEQANPQQLADAILWGYKNQKKLQSIGAKGQKLFQDNFSKEKISQKLKQII